MNQAFFPDVSTDRWLPLSLYGWVITKSFGYPLASSSSRHLSSLSVVLSVASLRGGISASTFFYVFESGERCNISRDTDLPGSLSRRAVLVARSGALGLCSSTRLQ